MKNLNKQPSGDWSTELSMSSELQLGSQTSRLPLPNADDPNYSGVVIRIPLTSQAYQRLAYQEINSQNEICFESLSCQESPSVQNISRKRDFKKEEKVAFTRNRIS